jgi:hypothetical protein
MVHLEPSGVAFNKFFAISKKYKYKGSNVELSL